MVRFAGNVASVSRASPVCEDLAGSVVIRDVPLPGTASPDRAPEQLFIRADPAGARPGRTLHLEALGIDPDNDHLTYQWSAAAGQFSNVYGDQADWTAPREQSYYPIQVTATDSEGLSRTEQIVVVVTDSPAPFNRPPLVEKLTASDLTPSPGETVRLSASASDPDDNPLTGQFYFTGSPGALVGPTEAAWRAPFRPGIYATFAVVSDGPTEFGWARQELSVDSEQTLDASAPSYGEAGQVLIDLSGFMRGLASTIRT